jgi:hypothetical protein
MVDFEIKDDVSASNKLEVYLKKFKGDLYLYGGLYCLLKIDCGGIVSIFNGIPSNIGLDVNDKGALKIIYKDE